MLIAKQVENETTLDDFVDVPFQIYKHDTAWVPPIRRERLRHFSAKYNPVFQSFDIALWVLYEGQKPVGRISAQIAKSGDKKHAGFFGCIEAGDDARQWKALLNVAEAWLSDRGATSMTGPFNLSINDECGLPLDAYASKPYILMPHAKDYYHHRLLEFGYLVARNLLAYEYIPQNEFPPATSRILASVASDPRIVLRRVRIADMTSEIYKLVDMFNDAWRGNWGFQPIEISEASYLAKDLRPLLWEGMIWIAYHDHEPAAFALSVPNVNELLYATQMSTSPFRWLAFLWKLRRRQVKTARMLLFGVRRKYHGSALALKLGLAVLDASRQAGCEMKIETSELSWILEDNHAIRHIVERWMGAKVTRRYALYDKAI